MNALTFTNRVELGVSMVYHRLFGAIFATVAASGIAIATLSTPANAATALKEGEAREWILWPTYSTNFILNNQQLLGNEYLLNAEPGDTLEISVKVGGGNLSPMLALFSVQNGQQVAFDDRLNSLAYQVPDDTKAGQYRLLIVAKNNTKGIYTLSLNRKRQPVASPPANTAANPTASNDPRRKILADDYGLKVLNNCPPSREGLVVVTFAEADAQYLYCANPNRFVQAGAYTYNPNNGNLETAAKPPERCSLVIGGVCVIK